MKSSPLQYPRWRKLDPRLPHCLGSLDQRPPRTYYFSTNCAEAFGEMQLVAKAVCGKIVFKGRRGWNYLLEMREVWEVAIDLVETSEAVLDNGWDWRPEVLITTSGPSGSDTRGFLKCSSDMLKGWTTTETVSSVDEAACGLFFSATFGMQVPKVHYNFSAKNPRRLHTTSGC